MVNLLLASGAAIIGAAAGAFGRDLIINKTVVVDATDLSDPKVVLQPKREKKKKEVKQQVEKVEEKVDDAEKEFPQEEDVAEAGVAIEKVEGEVVESNEKVEPATEPEIVLEPEPEKPVDQAEEKPKNKSKKAKAGKENQNTTASPEEPAIVTNTAETQPAQFTTIDKPVDKQEESQSTTEANNQ